MSDPYSKHTPGLQSPAMYLVDITPSDTEELPQATRALNVAASGFVRVTTVAGDEATVFIAAGIAFPIRVRKIWATGTDASGIVGMG